LGLAQDRHVSGAGGVAGSGDVDISEEGEGSRGESSDEPEDLTEIGNFTAQT
jgi:hypothetical protein